MAPHDQVVVITGATSGVGRAVARQLGARGCRIALLARGEAGLSATAEDVRQAGGTPLPIGLDVSDAAAITEAADRIERELGPIEIWINNAFSTIFAPFTDITPEEFRRVTEVTYLGYAHGTQAALKHMLPRDRGVVVQVGSALAYRGVPLQSAYCGAKHAIQGFTESVRCELLHRGSRVRITMVQLPAVNTPQFSWVRFRLPHRPRPIAPIYQPEVAARAVLAAAASPGRREHWVGSSTVQTLLVNAVAPGLLDRFLAREGFRAQQVLQEPAQQHDGNLFEPENADRGAHGTFDHEARAVSRQAWLSRHRGAVLSYLAIGLAVACAARKRVGLG